MSNIITNEDLYKNQYDYETLKSNIWSVSLIDMLKTQKLSSDFCVRYILNPTFHFNSVDKSITINDILKYQSHIKYDDLVISIIAANTKITRGERLDSFDDFETYSDVHE